MAIKVRGSNHSDSQGEDNKPKVDWVALNKYTVETADLQDGQVVVGVVSVLADVGNQKPDDACVVFTGTPEDEDAAIKAHPDTYFTDGYDKETNKPCRFKHWPRKEQPHYAMAIDIPSIKLNKGQFFGEDNEENMRVWFGGTFANKQDGRYISKPFSLKWTNLDKTRKTKQFSLASNSTLYKMAVEAGIIKKGECFEPTRIDELLGKAFLFNVKVYLNDGGFYTENVSLAGKLMKGQKVEGEVKTWLISMDDDLSEEALQQLRSEVLNTMRRSSDFETSKIREKIGYRNGQHGQDSSPQPQDNGTSYHPAETSNFDQHDDDAPF